jgi:phospholipid/cholesterol/gamma-HCH transport system substrate-binding protein
MYDYTKNLRWSGLRVGIVVSLSLVTIFFVVIFASNLGDLVAPKATIYADFADVKGLKTGAPVWLSGVQVGSVKGIDFKGAGAVRVAISVNKDYLRFIRRDSVATVNTMGILGDKYLDLSPGSERALRSGEVIPGTLPPDLQKIAGAGGAAITKLGEIEQRLEHVTYLIENGGGSASKFIKDPALYDNLNASSKRLSAILESVDEGRGTLGKLVRDDALYAELKASAGDLRKFTLSLRNSTGTLNRLIADKSLYENLDSSTKKLSAILDSSKKARGLWEGSQKTDAFPVSLNRP